MKSHGKAHVSTHHDDGPLRSVAGKPVRANKPAPQSLTREAILKLVHELEVHQIELEAQNVELNKSREAVEAALQKYADLYDFAPVGYFTLDRAGVMSALNISGAALLNSDRSRLTGRRFGQFVAKDQRTAFADFLDKVFAARNKVTAEVALLNPGGPPRIVQLEAAAAASGQECRIAAIDISQRRQTEDSLRESEARMYRLTEMAADAIIMLDQRGQVTFCNAAAERMFGCPGEELTHCAFHRNFIPQRLRTEARQGFTRFRDQGTGPLIGRTTEVTALRKDGTEFPVELSISALSIKGEWHAIAIMRDITERKRTDKDIQNAREYAESIVETVRRPLVVLDSELKILSANPNFYALFKVTADATEGKSIYDLGDRQWDIPRLRELLEGLLHHSKAFNSFEVVHEFPGIGRRIILLNARRIFRKNSGPQSILLAMEDITERRQAEERIREVIRQQQAILDNIPNSAWLKDREGRYVAVNEPFSRFVGLAPGDLVGKTDRDVYPAKLAEKYEHDFRTVLETGARAYFEESLTDREGKLLYLEKIKTPIFNDAGAIIGVIGIAHDITTRKELEVSLRHDSTHDSLTGLYNRAFFDEELERLSQGRKFPLSIVIADVNGLKTVNDTQGHEAGDKLLQTAARLLLGAFRADDIVVRFGGDEFAVLLPGAGEKVAEEAVARILQSKEILSGHVSIAFGIASAKSRGQIAEALRLSDERMYRNKSDQKDA